MCCVLCVVVQEAEKLKLKVENGRMQARTERDRETRKVTLRINHNPR